MMENKQRKFSNEQIQEIIITIFLLLVMSFIYIKILFF